MKRHIFESLALFSFILAQAISCAYVFAQPLPLVPRAVVTQASECVLCHMKKTHVFVPGVKRPFLEHKGFSLQHGSIEISCHSCHDANHGEKLRTSSEFPADYKNSSPVCQQCHSKEYKDWSNGLHGRRTGGWDASRTTRAQLQCIECHNPHSVPFKEMQASAPPVPPHGAPVPHVSEHKDKRPEPELKALLGIETADVQVREFPCTKCHKSYKSGQVVVKKEHGALKMQHMENVKNCILCHDSAQPNMLHMLSGDVLPYAKTVELCSQCHGKISNQWRLGFHGRQSVGPDGKKTRLSCGECHNAHSPKFELMKASAKPEHPSERNNRHE